MGERQTVTVSVFDKEQYDGEWPPSALVDAVAWFQTKLEQIPQEYRHTAQCEIDSVGGAEVSHYGHIAISYRRPETDEEMQHREAKALADAEARRARELAQLVMLQAKYQSAP